MLVFKVFYSNAQLGVSMEDVAKAAAELQINSKD